MTSSPDTVLFWFTQDLRLHDNPALTQAISLATSHNKRLLCLVQTLDTAPTRWGFDRASSLRQVFRQHAIDGLKGSLESMGVELIETPYLEIAALQDVMKQAQVSHVVCEQRETPEELAVIQGLMASGLRVTQVVQSSLFEDDQLPFKVSQTPDVFTAFRQAMESRHIEPKSPLPSVYPHSSGPISVQPRPYALDPRASFPFNQPQWHADEFSALAHVNRYFASDLPQSYKQTRNALTGTDYSTKFSPWLAVGTLSPRVIWQRLKAHEQAMGANKSTYWIGFELLWREHFRLMARKYGARLFARRGLLNVKSSTSANAATAGTTTTHSSTQHLDAWRLGQTKQPLIDAAMNELRVTGFLSNRLRQIVASYAIYDLGIDWRAGAAWFEHCLIDYDVHSNQGNWAYIAGVGTDPRGGRPFNVLKQMRDHDPDGHYQSLWSRA